MSLFSNVPLTLVCAVGVILLLVIFFGPLKRIVKFLLHAALGFALLFALNLFGGSFGITLPVNLLNCIIAGFLGLPGVIILLFYTYFM